jgi:predicted heme/steroid binding protein
LENRGKFTVEELSQFDGEAGRCAYVAYKDKVHYVSDSYEWVNGGHFGEHNAK